ncbi:glycosyltransferase family 2 protein [Patescibacteria group bacterium]|nr:glycosyltransferase family 2 protein [Patescibacteria group bacterium]MBU1472821.1 glycosyltransferase family 2 protein [Patescibacteria group bacterium]MBU2460371.1 glycosyltransferase family 2 protein [Patescibacteria group bacterium]MBU2544051.1 glycosyltransferase family 2 protein [Patescibacteria group bacterium]
MITAVVLSRNDAEYIGRTLESIHWCDEVVVIDDDSTDDTGAICERFGARVYVRALHKDFASQRNFGLSKARGEWVFFVDSDEIVSSQLASEIQLVVKNATKMPNANVGYFVRRKDFFGGRWLLHGETANVRLLRLAKRNAGIWMRPVHEVWKITGPVGILREPLLHYPHPDVAQFIDSINWYSTVNAQYLFRQKIRESWWKIPVYPAAKFFYNYICRLGFLDGTAGAVVAIMMSFHSFLTRAKLWKLWDRD